MYLFIFYLKRLWTLSIYIFLDSGGWREKKSWGANGRYVVDKENTSLIISLIYLQYFCISDAVDIHVVSYVCLKDCKLHTKRMSSQTNLPQVSINLHYILNLPTLYLESTIGYEVISQIIFIFHCILSYINLFKSYSNSITSKILEFIYNISYIKLPRFLISASLILN